MTRLALLARYPERDDSGPRVDFPNYGIRRVQAALSGAAGLEDLALLICEPHDEPPAAIAAEVHRWDPDVVGVSAYVWSLKVLHPVARELHRLRPDRTVIYGGPSAHPNAFGRAPFDDVSFVSALAPGAAGVHALGDVLRLGRRGPDELAGIPGLLLPVAGGFRSTGQRSADGSLNDSPSPYQQGLMTAGNIALLQTYFGCPLDCSYCSWGALGDPHDVLSVDYLVRELRAFERLGLVGALLVDAALNLNDHAFAKLAEAERRVGFFRHSALIMEVYPKHLRQEHLDFISSVQRPQVSVGLQSYDPAVLDQLERPFDANVFEQAVRTLSRITHLNIEIMLGLPGDNPKSFWRTFERVRQLPSNLRVYHCLVLPDALAARAPARFAMRWDPVTFKMQSCWGWSAAELAECAERLTELAAAEGSTSGEFWWSFDRRDRRPWGGSRP